MLYICRQLLYEALNSQLEERIPFLYGTIRDVHEHNSGAQVKRQFCAFYDYSYEYKQTPMLRRECSQWAFLQAKYEKH